MSRPRRHDSQLPCPPNGTPLEVLGLGVESLPARRKGGAAPCDTLQRKSQSSLADVASGKKDRSEKKQPFDGLSSSRRSRRRLCGGRMSGASLARRRVDEYDRRPHSATSCRSSARSVAPTLAPRRSRISSFAELRRAHRRRRGRSPPIICGRRPRSLWRS